MDIVGFWREDLGVRYAQQFIEVTAFLGSVMLDA